MVDRGEGIYLFDTAGRRYIDFTSGIGVTSTGHCHPEVVSAIQKQAAKLIHGQMNLVYHQPVLALTDSLIKILPPSLDSLFFSNSGAEAVEAAVKLSKHATGRTNVIVFSGSFHGRTHLTMTMTTSKTGYRLHYQPLVPGVFVAPYPYSYALKMDEEKTVEHCLQELDRLLRTQTTPDEVACIVIEPVLGEGGYVVPPKRFLQELQMLCTKNGILLVADEVQCGFGRTGKYFASEHFGLVPDVMVMAKGIASGLPLSSIATRKELAAKWRTGSHGGTYGGNALACAAAIATIMVIQDENLLENATARGTQLMNGLRELRNRCSMIGDVRGLGLMVGLEFTKNGEPNTDFAKAVVKEAARNEPALVLLTCGTYDNVIRWIPPLIVTELQMEEALTIFETALQKVMDQA
jgi:4-aminobutyrate aminotransferase